MITCGRCGEPAGVGGFGNSFRIFERFIRDGQKMGVCVDLCDRCQKELVVWLNEGGYAKNHDPALPVKNPADAIHKLHGIINRLTDEMNDYASRVSQIVRTDENGQND